jgi:hypothetical protein
VHAVIFAAIAFVLGCLTVLAPRPIPRTAFLSGFIATIFVALDAAGFGVLLVVLASVLLVVDLCLYREPKPFDDIEDRLTASATIETPDDSVHLHRGSVTIVIADKHGDVKLLAPHACAEDLLQQIKRAGITMRQVAP